MHAVDFNPYADEIHEDPFPRYQQLRATDLPSALLDAEIDGARLEGHNVMAAIQAHLPDFERVDDARAAANLKRTRSASDAAARERHS